MENFNRKIRTLVVYHDYDLDGFMSCLLMTKILQKQNKYIDQVGFNYGNKNLAGHDLQNISENHYLNFDEYYFVDCCPTNDFLNNIGTKAKINIFDHHKNRIDYILQKFDYREFNIVTNDDKHNYSGCKLIWNHYLNDLQKIFSTYNFHYFDNLVDKISMFDTWEFTKLIDCEMNDLLAIIEFLNQCHTEYDFCYLIEKYISEAKMIEIGNYYVEKIKNKNIRSINEGKNIIIGTDEFLMLDNTPNYYLEDSINLGYAHAWTGYVCYHFDIQTQTVKLSFRVLDQNSTIDLIPIVKSLDPNGGGHSKACGCTISFQQFINLLNHGG